MKVQYEMDGTSVENTGGSTEKKKEQVQKRNMGM